MQCDSYSKPPSNQMQLDGMSDEGGDLMREARGWTREHLTEWTWYRRFAREQCADGGKASPNFVLQAMRNHFRVSVPNAYAPALARIAMEGDPAIRFRVAKSMVDGFTTAVL